MKASRAGWTFLTLLVLAWVVLAGAIAYGADRWASPEVATPTAQLPRLTQPLELDGLLSEWQAAACVPVRVFADISFISRKHKWLGPGDAGMEVYCAWNADGLCLAAVVADQDIRNDRPDQQLWEQDCVELFVDGRAADRFLKPPYTKGAYQVLVRPPLAGRQPQAVVIEAHGEIPGLRVAGKATAAGYVIELLVPWDAFPEFSPGPGAHLGLEFALDDYDARDAAEFSIPIQLSCGGQRVLYVWPDRFIEWVLVEEPETGKQVALAPRAVMDSPRVYDGYEAMPVAVELGRLLSAQVGSVRVSATDADGRSLLDRTVPVSPNPPPWDECVRARLKWRPQPAADGFGLVTVTVNDKQGLPLGSIARPVLFFARTSREILARLRAVDVSKLAAAEPFKAAAYLGAAACYEKLKVRIETQHAPLTVRTAREMTARLDVLERGRVTGSDLGLRDLLNLTADPEAQVVVEFPEGENRETATVLFYWGAIPLASARVAQYSSEDEAANSLQTGGWLLADLSHKATVAGWPAVVWSRSYSYDPFIIGEFSPERQVVVASVRDNFAGVIATDMIPLAQVDAVVILADCPPATRDAVLALAQERDLPVVGFEEATTQGRVLLAGDVRQTEAADWLAKLDLSPVKVQDRPIRLSLAARDRTISISSLSRDICERVARLVLAGKPVRPGDVDALRIALVRELAPAGAPAVVPSEMSLFCGDADMHTFYSSDGFPSPVGLALEAMYSYMDYAVISDHNTIAGAQLAQSLLAKHGISFPLIVGEEITTEWSHFNAYPLRAVVSWELSPYETVKAAHMQGAVIQWNHPYPKSEWAVAHFKPEIQEVGLDAWEHIPGAYDEWKEAGVLPVIVGATDTHDGSFGYPERTIILAPTPEGEDLAEAIRRGQVVAVAPEGRLFYGPDRMLSVVWVALAEGKGLKAATAERLQAALAHADIIGLLLASEPRPVETEAAAGR